MDSKKKKDIPIYRVAVLGMMSVGKTSIVSQFVNNNFDSQYEETCKDIRQYRKLIDISKGDQSNHQYCILIIDDIFGLNHPSIENYGSMDKQNKEKLIAILENNYIKNNGFQPKIFLQKQIYGYIFVYDAMEKGTLEYLKKYIEHIEENEDKKKSGIVTKKALVGNKFDLIAEKDKEKLLSNKPKEIKELMEKHDLVHYFCSASENYNVDQIFQDMVRSIMGDIKFEMVENDFLQATKEFYPKRQKPEKIIEQQKKIKLQQNQTAGFWSTLGCGNRDMDDDSDEDNEERSNNDENNDEMVIPKFEKAEEKKCNLF